MILWHLAVWDSSVPGSVHAISIKVRCGQPEDRCSVQILAKSAQNEPLSVTAVAVIPHSHNATVHKVLVLQHRQHLPVL